MTRGEPTEQEKEVLAALASEEAINVLSGKNVPGLQRGEYRAKINKNRNPMKHLTPKKKKRK